MSIKENFIGKSFLTLKDFTSEEIIYLVDLAAEYKDKKKKGNGSQLNTSFSKEEKVVFSEFLNGLSERFKSYSYENKNGTNITELLHNS